jgi:hypothetical protein
MTDDELNRRFDTLMMLMNDNHERLIKQLSAIRDDIAVNLASTERAVRVNDNTRDEMRGLNEILTAMQRQIRRLNSVVFSDDKDA